MFLDKMNLNHISTLKTNLLKMHTGIDIINFLFFNLQLWRLGFILQSKKNSGNSCPLIALKS